MTSFYNQGTGLGLGSSIFGDLILIDRNNNTVNSNVIFNSNVTINNNLYTSNIYANYGNFSNMFSSNISCCNVYGNSATFSNMFSSNISCCNIFGNSATFSNITCCNLFSSNITCCNINGKSYKGGLWGNNLNTVYLTNSNVGIHTPIAQYPLDVLGDINFSFGALRSNSQIIGFGTTEIDNSIKYNQKLTVVIPPDIDAEGVPHAGIGLHLGLAGLSAGFGLFGALTVGKIICDSFAFPNGQAFVSSLWDEKDGVIYAIQSNVAIGKKTADYALDINGDINVSGKFRSNNIEIKQHWNNSNNIVYMFDSNVSIGVSNPTCPLQVEGTIQSTRMIANGGGFNNFIGTNAQINNLTVVNGVFNDLTVNQSINCRNPLNTQIFNTIIKSGSSPSLFVAVSWDILNTNTYYQNNFLLKISHDITLNDGKNGYRTEKFKINTTSQTLISDNHANASGDLIAYTSLFIFSTSINSKSVIIESRTTKTNITLHNFSVNVLLIPTGITNVILS